MALLLALSPAPDVEPVLPALELLSHSIRRHPMDPSHLLSLPEADAVLVDARADLIAARAACRLLQTAGLSIPVLLIVTEGGLSAV